MDRNRTKTKKPPVKKLVNYKNTKPPVEALTKPSVWKKFWLAVNFDWKALIATIALIFSILTYCQNSNRQAKQDRIQEERYQATMLKLEIEKLKNDAREWFADGEYKKSVECYQEVYLLNQNDVEGYRKFLTKGKELLKLNKDGKCDPDIIMFFEDAKKLTNDTVEIDKELKQCE